MGKKWIAAVLFCVLAITQWGQGQWGRQSSPSRFVGGVVPRATLFQDSVYIVQGADTTWLDAATIAQLLNSVSSDTLGNLYLINSAFVGGPIYSIHDGDTLWLNPNTASTVFGLQINGSNKFTVDSTGAVIAAGDITGDDVWVTDTSQASTFRATTRLVAVGPNAAKATLDSTSLQIVSGDADTFAVNLAAGLEAIYYGNSGGRVWSVDTTGIARAIKTYLGAPAALDSAALVATLGKLTIATPSIGITQADGNGIFLINPTRDTTSGAPVQYTPPIRFMSYATKTTAPRTAQHVQWLLEGEPVNGSTVVTGNFVLKNSINGAAWTTPLTLSSAGLLTLVGGATIGGDITVPNLGRVRADGNNIYIGDASTNFILMDVANSRYARVQAAGGSTAATNVFIVNTNNALTNTSGTTTMLQINPSYSPTSGSAVNRNLSITPTYNQTTGGGANTAQNDDIYVYRTETAIGSGQQNLLYMATGAGEKFRVNNKGSFWPANSFVQSSGLITTNEGGQYEADTLVDAAFVTLGAGFGVAIRDTVTLRSFTASNKLGVEKTFACVALDSTVDSLVIVPAAKAGYNSVYLGLYGTATFIWSGSAWFIKSNFHGVIH